MDEPNPREPSDESLEGVLESWQVESPSSGLEARLRVSFRAQAHLGRGPWTRWLGATVRVPVPVLLGLVATCVLTTGFALLGRGPRPPMSVQGLEAETTPSKRSASFLGFEPVSEPKLTVLRPGERP